MVRLACATLIAMMMVTVPQAMAQDSPDGPAAEHRAVPVAAEAGLDATDPAAVTAVDPCIEQEPCPETAEVVPAQYSRLGGAVLDMLRQGSIFVLH